MREKVVLLTGGVGGAKLALGLTQIIPQERITAIVNTGDDFRHLGLWISPDMDTLLYTLAGTADSERGWGRAGETWNFMAALRAIGGDDWFRLGDADLALHILRTERLNRGEVLSEIAGDLARASGVRATILPMSDEPVSTHVLTDRGELPFQRYFVEQQCRPVAEAVRFKGAREARPAPGVIEALSGIDTRAILIAPSNPFLSIDPILAVPGIREALAAASAPVVAVSPIVGGAAVKGPTAKLMEELGMPVTPGAVARHYSGLIDAMVVDKRDSAADLAIAHVSLDTLMVTLADRARVAACALDLAARIGG